MENPYEGHNYQPYTPQSEPDPSIHVYDGNQSLATVSLVMGILALLSLCCFPFGTFVFSGLGILFSCLSKGQYKRSGNAKAAMAICVSCLTILTAVVITVCTFFLVTEKGQSFIRDYIGLITSQDISDEDLYDFLNKYLYGSDEDGTNFYPNPDLPYDSYEGPSEDYDKFFDYYFDNLPNYQPQPDTGGGSNVI